MTVGAYFAGRVGKSAAGDRGASEIIGEDGGEERDCERWKAGKSYEFNGLVIFICP